MANCLMCENAAVEGVILYGPIMGVTLVERCPGCEIYLDDRGAAKACEGFETHAIEVEGHWYLDFFRHNTVNSIIRDALARVKTTGRRFDLGGPSS
jgi:hypothetical protein